MKPFIRPEYLKPGDTVAVVAMASALSAQSRQTLYWKEMLESWGLHVKTGRHLYDSAPGDFAGRDEDRAADIAEALLDPEVKALYESLLSLSSGEDGLFDAEDYEDQITCNADNTYTVTGSENETGTYTIDGSKVTFVSD